MVGFGSGGRGFRFVYDCGAMPKYASARGSAIARYISGSGGPGSQLDVLFLSHAHADHINGVPELLASGTGLKVDTIVLPLTTGEERLMAFAAGVAADPAIAADVFLRGFVVDDVAALASLGPRQVIRVERGEGDGETPSPGRERFTLPTEGGGDLWIGGGEDGVSRATLVGGVPPSGSEEIQSNPGVIARTIKDTSSIGLGRNPISPVWLLSPYVDPGVEKGREAFLTELARLTGIPRTVLQTKSGIAALLDDKDHVSDLREAYMSLGHDLNVTSLCLYSGPVPRFAPPRIQDFFRRDPPRRYGWLAAGDANLKNSTLAKNFVGHYRHHLEAVGTFVLPHHGSENNLNGVALDAIMPGLCIAAADAFKGWRHPGSAVVQQIASRGVPLKLVTSDDRSRAVEIGRVRR